MKLHSRVEFRNEIKNNFKINDDSPHHLNQKSLLCPASNENSSVSKNYFFPVGIKKMFGESQAVLGQVQDISVPMDTVVLKIGRFMS